MRLVRLRLILKTGKAVTIQREKLQDVVKHILQLDHGLAKEHWYNCFRIILGNTHRILLRDRIDRGTKE
jgi:hypothetical protein